MVDIAGSVPETIASAPGHRAKPDQGARVKPADGAPDVGRQPDLGYDLLLMFARNELSAQATLLLLAVIFSLASCFWAPWTQAGLWLLLVIAAKVILLEVCRRFVAAADAALHVEVWRKRFIIAEAINGCAWAGFALVGIATDKVATQDALFSSHVFIFASLIVILAIRMTFASPVMPILLIGTVPMTLAVVARLVLVQEFFFFALAMMAVGVHVYFIFLAKGMNSTAVAMLKYRNEKDGLISDLEEATRMSDIARRRAEEANIAKSRFLATMSHELRTPLNAILGFSEVMKDQIMGPLENPTYNEYVTNIHSSGSHLLKLINEILDLSRVEAGRYELHEEAIRLTDIAEDCEQLLRLKAEAKNTELRLELNDRLSQVWVDQRALRQVCLNLMSNALKFTPANGLVIVRVEPAGDGGQVLSIIDNGPGIPADEIPKVMQAFGQGSLAYETAEGGTGLGLPIVKELVELHGGSFELLSELGKGTQAVVSLPPERTLRPVPAASGKARPVGKGTRPVGQKLGSVELAAPKMLRPGRIMSKSVKPPGTPLRQPRRLVSKSA